MASRTPVPPRRRVNVLAGRTAQRRSPDSHARARALEARIEDAMLEAFERAQRVTPSRAMGVVAERRAHFASPGERA